MSTMKTSIPEGCGSQRLAVPESHVDYSSWRSAVLKSKLVADAPGLWKFCCLQTCYARQLLSRLDVFQLLKCFIDACGSSDLKIWWNPLSLNFFCGPI